MDGFLLACLTIASSLHDDGSYGSNYTKIRNAIVFISVIVPLVGLAFGVFMIVIVRFGIASMIKKAAKKCNILKGKPSNEANTNYSTAVPTASLPTVCEIEVVAEREPLISELQDSSDYGSVIN